MNNFVITSPEGKEFEISAPDGATESQALEYAKQQFSQPSATQEQPAKEDLSPVDYGEEAGYWAQAGRGMMDVYQGGKQLALNSAQKINEFTGKVDEAADTMFAKGTVPNAAVKSLLGGWLYLVPELDAKPYNEQLSQELKIYNKDNPDFQAARMLGSIATPLSLVPGGRAKSFGGKMLSGSTTGSVFSLFQPVENVDEYWAEKGEQALWGGGFGGSIPVAGKMFGSVTGWVDELSKPFFKDGVVRDVGKFLKQHLTENKDKILRSINQAIKDGDKRTVGQIIADTTRGTGDDFGGMLVRLEKDLARESDALKSLYATQSKSRVDFIDSLSGTSDDFIRAVENRKQNGVKNYLESFKEEVIPDDNLKKLLDNKYAKTALSDAMDLAQAKGTESISEVIHFIKLGLDKQLAKKADQALSKTEAKIVDKVKKDIVNWLEGKNTLYEKARKQYQLDSQPINRMRLGQELKGKLVNSLEEDKPSVFATAVKEGHKILKKATGIDRYKKLDDILSPEETTKLKTIVSEMAAEKKAAKMASASKPILKDLSSEVSFSLPHILSRPIVITNHLLSKLGQDKSPEYKEILISAIKDPKKFARIYGGSSQKPKTKMAIDIARRLNTIIASQEAAKESGSE